MRGGLVLGILCVAIIVLAIILALTSGRGPEVTPVEPRGATRIVSLAPSETEILFALGVGDRVVGVTDWCDYPPEAARKPKVGGYIDFSIEKVDALAPDLVLVAHGIPKERVEQLRALGRRVYGENPTDFAGVMRHIQTVGKMVGAEGRAREVVTRMRREMDAVTSRVAHLTKAQRPSVMYGSWDAPIFVAGPGTFIDEAIRLAGGVNMAEDSTTPWPVGYSLEKVVAHDPQIIVRGYQAGKGLSMGERTQGLEALRRDPVWRDISAVKTGRVYWIDENLLVRPGPRLTQGLMDLARIIHPELFPSPATAATESGPASASRPGPETHP